MIPTLLFLHVVAGVIALVAAGLAVGSVKGGQMHRRSGRAYTLAMMIVGATALVLAMARSDAFLFAVGMFSLFLVFTGWRAAAVRDGRPRWIDHAGGGLMAVTGTAMLASGAEGVIRGAGAQPEILLAFG